MRFAIWRLNLAIRDVVSFKHFLIFVIRENEIFMSVNRDPLFCRFVNRARDPPLDDPRKCGGLASDG